MKSKKTLLSLWPSVDQWIREHPVLICIIFIGFLVRFLFLGSIPPGLNQDEAMTAYDAWSVLHFGIDHYGVRLPTMFIAWGSGMSALSGYLAWPSMLIFGLSEFSIRLPHCLLGVLALLITYKLIQEISGENAALLTTLLLAVNPWHIMASRWAHEANILPTLMLLAVYFFVKATKKKEYSIFALGILAFSLYFYATALAMVPIFSFLAVFALWFWWRTPVRTLFFASEVAIIIALPMILYVAINQFNLNAIDFFATTIPKLTSPARYSTLSSLFSSTMGTDIYENGKTLWRLLVHQEDYIWNSMPGTGLLYVFGLPLSGLGLIVVLREIWQKKGKHPMIFIVLWLIAAILLGLLLPANTNRVNVIFLPLIYFGAHFVHVITKNHAFVRIIAVVTVSIFFGTFVHSYFWWYPKEASGAFFQGLGPSIRKAASATEKPICVTAKANMPYISVLFYNQIDPQEFKETVDYENPGAEFQNARSFGRYTFGLDHCAGKEYGAYVLHRNEREQFGKDAFQLFDFEHYSAAIPRRL